MAEAERRETGHYDMHCRPILEGDHMRIPEHANQCCRHMIRCVVERDAANNRWVLMHDGEIVGSMGLAAGYAVTS